ncbi:hypothetical protein K470DRAFT_254019 [Piedraia hortae CBS 480.64]|uniref:DUF2415 domain-containing protein n=1 Tax=Piedraia hortae CBS 480.64 TaxID=1314780 RepID=A0A6A7CD95_9PEZI|nr:hypothetical protein K470DRAFT_254019 [Piedraia hortae CBS 480.64]
MARGTAIDYSLYPGVDNLARERDKAFYEVNIQVSHPQLRHFVSTPEPDVLFYASGYDIFSLDTVTKKRKHVALLPFQARCTASGYGYICVGGEDSGRFAAIKLSSRGQRPVDVDSALPINEGLEQRDATGRTVESMQVERIGSRIVNSISIHHLKDESTGLDDIVAVLTNNDKTVRMYSLIHNMETNKIDFPDAMNHATISPDGCMLVAVGDVEQAYFYRRKIKSSLLSRVRPRGHVSSFYISWALSRVVDLYPEKGAGCGCFTTAWSPSGGLVAVGSEGGYISMFDAEAINDANCEDDDSRAALMPSSRPVLATSHAGAVRAMMFAPDPYDLLIWAEDRGRIGIGDLRTGLKKRQVVHLNPKEEGLKKIVYADQPKEEGSTTPRALRPLGRFHIDDESEDWLARREERSRRVRREIDSTEREMQVINSVHNARLQEAARRLSRRITYSSLRRMDGSDSPPLQGASDSPDQPATDSIAELVAGAVADSLPELSHMRERESSPVHRSTSGRMFEALTRGVRSPESLDRIRARARAQEEVRDIIRQQGAAETESGTPTTLDLTRSLLITGHGVTRRHLQTLLNETQSGERVVGLAMSSDGRTLWAACELGIFELPLNVDRRHLWAALEPA